MLSSKTLLLRNADRLVTMDGDDTEIADGGLFARNGWIEQVGPTAGLPDTADEVIDCRGQVVIPGLVNTHHHFFQTLTRAMAQDSELFGWLEELYPVWSRLTPEHVRVSTVTALAELALSGCTTAFDHHYFWINGASVDDQVEAASAGRNPFSCFPGLDERGPFLRRVAARLEWVEDEDRGPGRLHPGGFPVSRLQLPDP